MCRPLSKEIRYKLKKTTKSLKALADAVIDKLQNYFGMALCANTGGTVQKMADAIWFSFLHVSSNKKHQYHSLCEKTWCQYRRDEANSTNLFQHGPGLPNEVVALVKHIYKNLIKHEELGKCLHGKTQNQNESLNALIWKRAPMNVYLSLEKIRFAVYDAVAVLSDGRQGSLNVLKGVSVKPGYYTTELCCMLNVKRKMRSSNWLSETTRIVDVYASCSKEEVIKRRTAQKRNMWKENRTKLVVSDCYFNFMELCNDCTVGFISTYIILSCIL